MQCHAICFIAVGTLKREQHTFVFLCLGGAISHTSQENVIPLALFGICASSFSVAYLNTWRTHKMNMARLTARARGITLCAHEY